MRKIEVMDHSGHRTHVFGDASKLTTEQVSAILAEAGSDEPVKSVDEARAIFDNLTRKGYTMAKTVGRGQHEHLREFDPEADMVAYPQLRGG